MGDDPVKARLKVDWDSLDEVDEDDWNDLEGDVDEDDDDDYVPTVHAPAPPVTPRSRAGRLESAFTEMWEALESFWKLSKKENGR